jgi:hypothetical protein
MKKKKKLKASTFSLWTDAVHSKRLKKERKRKKTKAYATG